MNIISVQASRNYDVVIGENLLEFAADHISPSYRGRKAAIVSDSNVWPFYGKTLTESLQKAGIITVHFVFPAGESSKNPETYLQILNFFARNHLTRADIAIALGGGVVGDITGFAAATYLRGISYIQVPTSLLAMVDSSVGGKTAIDLPAGKNLVGAFKQPELVLCDIGTLKTLPKRQFLDGCAEVIKYGMLYDSQMITYLLDTGPSFDLELIISKCITFKRDVVREDEFDTGLRQKLNLGHTVAHGIEAGSDYTISHGQAVAAGMAIITRAAVSRGLCSRVAQDKLCALLEKFSLPVNTDISAEDLYLSALSDKKRASGSVNLIVPKELGNCQIMTTPVGELKSFIEAGL